MTRYPPSAEELRLRKTVLILMDACTADPDQPRTETYGPTASLLTDTGDLDWSLTLEFLGLVMDGSQPCDALDEVARTRESPRHDLTYLQRHPADTQEGTPPPR